MAALASLAKHHTNEPLAAMARSLVRRGWRLQSAIPVLGRLGVTMGAATPAPQLHVHALASADILMTPGPESSLSQLRANDNW